MDDNTRPHASGLKRSFRRLEQLTVRGMSPHKRSKHAAQALAQDGPADTPSTTDTPNTPASTPAASAILQDAALDKPSVDSSAASDGSAASTASSQKSLSSRPSRKWLGGTGSWRSKAPAVVKTAKESIRVTGGATSELPGEDAKKPKDQAPTKFLTKRKSSKSDAISPSMTKLTVSSDGSIDEAHTTKSESTKDSAEPSPKVDEPPLPPDPPKPDRTSQFASTFGWRSWWSRPDGYSDAGKAKDAPQDSTADAQSTPLPGATPSEETDAKAKDLPTDDATARKEEDKNSETKNVPDTSNQHQDTEMKEASQPQDIAPKTASTSSWFWLWSSTQNAKGDLQKDSPNNGSETATGDTAAEPSAAEPPQPLQKEITEVPPQADNSATATKESTKPSGWAFWFREKSKADINTSDGASQKQVGEVAVFNTPSQSHPEAAQFNEQADQPTEGGHAETTQTPPEEPAPKRSFRSLRGRPKKTIAKATSSDPASDAPAKSAPKTPTKDSPAPSSTPADAAGDAQSTSKQPAKTKQEPANLILPEFKNTYHLVQKPSYWQQIRQYFLGDEPAMPHLHINPAPPRIKKAVAIGIHGFFPAPIFQKVLGQPQGTSIRFANAAATAIKDWTGARGYTPDIEQIALEGEGFVAERVNTLWKLLLNWIDHIKAADFIFVACHSQGVPVAIMLVAKLIQFGCVNASRIGVCAMAGVNMGPFMEYKTKYFGPTAAELFEFSNPKSLVSQMYLASLDEVLRFGVRILYAGSIDDQLVSLESSTFSSLAHPYIYRAVFVDGRIHAPDFLTHLVGFTLKLRNLGLPDHSFIRELSPALAGSLYGGEGHSRVYEDARIYELAIQHALETTSLPVQSQQRPNTSAPLSGLNIPVPGAKADAKDPYALQVKDYHGSATSANQNPFFLPWAMRGLLEEEFVKKELGREVEELLNMFEEWRPTSKQLKDVKFRLEGVRSKL